MSSIHVLSLRLLVLGATGGVGRELVEQALLRGHRVTALVRSPEKLEPTSLRLTVVLGNPLDSDTIANLLPGHDAVLSALGPSGLGRTTVVSEGARSTILAMEETGVQRLLIVSVAMLFRDAGLVAAALRNTFLRNVAADAAEMERLVRTSSLDFTIVRPPRLTYGPLSGRVAAADDHLPKGAGGTSTASRADVANFMLEELVSNEHVRRVVGVAAQKRKVLPMHEAPISI